MCCVLRRATSQNREEIPASHQTYDSGSGSRLATLRHPRGFTARPSWASLEGLLWRGVPSRIGWTKPDYPGLRQSECRWIVLVTAVSLTSRIGGSERAMMRSPTDEDLSWLKMRVSPSAAEHRRQDNDTPGGKV